jgi:uncharacterized phage protein (TIGR02220 family)
MYSMYFRFWAEECLGKNDPDGFNLVEILDAEERAFYFALYALCASSPLQPLVCRDALTGYTPAQLGDITRARPGVVKTALAKLQIEGKVEIDSANVILITDWPRHGGKYFINRKYRDGEARIWSMREELAKKQKEAEKRVVYKEVITHLNWKLKAKFRISSEAQFHHVSARMDEGASLEDFKHVIDVKFEQWYNHPTMARYLRPATLFNSETFWGYVNERLVKRSTDPNQSRDYKWLPEEEEMYGRVVAEEYDKKLAAYKIEKGIVKDEDIDWMSIPTLAEYRLRRIIQLRGSPEYKIVIKK